MTYWKQYYGYDTISEREKVSDPVIAEIVDYIERNYTSIERKQDKSGSMIWEINGVIQMRLWDGEIAYITFIDENREKHLAMTTPLTILKQNKIGILASIRDYSKWNQ